MSDFQYTIRRATEGDLSAMAEAHRASILEIAPKFYPPEAVADWGRERDIQGYLDAMKKGVTYFIAEQKDRPGYVLGLSSCGLVDDCHHLRMLYVRGTAARCGIGKNLLNVAEEFARSQGAKEFHVQGSLSGEAFYKAAGFTELSRHQISMGPVSVPAIMMRKDLTILSP